MWLRRACRTSRWCATWWRAAWWSGRSTVPTGCTSSCERAGHTARSPGRASCGWWRTWRPPASRTSAHAASSTRRRARRCTRCNAPPWVSIAPPPLLLQYLFQKDCSITPRQNRGLVIAKIVDSWRSPFISAESAKYGNLYENRVIVIVVNRHPRCRIEHELGCHLNAFPHVPVFVSKW